MAKRLYNEKNKKKLHDKNYIIERLHNKNNMIKRYYDRRTI